MQNEPVAIGGAVAILTAILTPILAKYGIDADGTAKIVGVLGAVATAALSVYSVWKARSKVTPVVTNSTTNPNVPPPAK